MKQSYYNLFLPYEGMIIAYSGLADEYLVLQPELYAVFEGADTAFLSLQKEYPDLYQMLIDKKFIIGDEVNELQECLKNFYAQDNQNMNYQLFINPTMNCNFKCWYCYETHIKDSKINPQVKDNIIKFIAHTLQTEKTLFSFNIGWFGGEPLLYFKKLVVPIMQAGKTLCAERQVRFSSSITTNGLLVDETVIAASIGNDLMSFQITLDGHRARHNQVRFISETKGSYDEIVANIKQLVKNGIRVNVRVNCSKETFEGLEQIAQDFSNIADADREFIRFDFHKIWQVEEALEEHMETYVELFRSNGFSVTASGVSPKRDSCYADKKNHVTINYNGEVFKCTARDFKSENKEGVLSDKGTIVWNDKYQERFALKYGNKSCQTCVVFPACGGGCSQQTLEHKGADYCVYGYDRKRKEQMILDRFLSSL